ncbi:unnamed protein product [Heterobilharzia americana]|nr:unnamed protein product [Heterobilharzia americana]
MISEVQDINQPSEDSLVDHRTPDELCGDLQRALETRSSELETVKERMRACESVNSALMCECESLKRRLEGYTTVTTDLENDVSRAKSLLPLVVSELRDLRCDYGDWCREHEQRVLECLDAVGTALPDAVVERVDRECETTVWPEHSESPAVLDDFVQPHKSSEEDLLTRKEQSVDDTVSEVNRLCDANRELSEELCKYQDLCDKQASEIVSMQTALREAVEQASSARDELEVYRQEKTGVLSELESRLAVSREECTALEGEVLRLEMSIEENCRTAVSIASRDWELQMDQVVSERDTALKELLELRARLAAADSLDVRPIVAVCTSDVGTQRLDSVIEGDVALSSGLTGHPRETVSVGVGQDVEADEVNFMVVDGWSGYNLECTRDESEASGLLSLSTGFVDAEVQVMGSELRWMSDRLSEAAAVELSSVDQSTSTPMEVVSQQFVSESVCVDVVEDASKSVDELRAELAFCHEQIAMLSRSVQESGDSLRDVRHLLSVKEREVAELEEEKRRLSEEVSDGRESLRAEQRDFEVLRAKLAALESETEVSARCVQSGASDTVVEEVCVQTEMDDVFDLVSRLQLEVSKLRRGFSLPVSSDVDVSPSDVTPFIGGYGFSCLSVELSDLRQKFSRVSFSLASSIDLVNFCLSLMRVWSSLFLNLLSFSFSRLDSGTFSVINGMLRNIICLCNSCASADLFGDLNFLVYFKQLSDLIDSVVQPPCYLCGCSDFGNSLVLSCLCNQCNSLIQSPIFRTSSLKPSVCIESQCSVGDDCNNESIGLFDVDIEHKLSSSMSSLNNVECITASCMMNMKSSLENVIESNEKLVT